MEDSGSSVMLENVLLTDNVTTNNGGAIHVGSGTTANVIRSTVSGNSAAGSGETREPTGLDRAPQWHDRRGTAGTPGASGQSPDTRSRADSPALPMGRAT